MRSPLQDRSTFFSTRPLFYLSTGRSGTAAEVQCVSTNGEHHVTVPRHRSLRVGTLAAVLDEVARHHGMTRSHLVELLVPN